MWNHRVKGHVGFEYVRDKAVGLGPCLLSCRCAGWCVPAHRAEFQHVAIYYESTIEHVSFAAQEIRDVMQQRGLAVAEKPLVESSDQSWSPRIIAVRNPSPTCAAWPTEFFLEELS